MMPITLYKVSKIVIVLLSFFSSLFKLLMPSSKSLLSFSSRSAILIINASCSFRRFEFRQLYLTIDRERWNN